MNTFFLKLLSLLEERFNIKGLACSSLVFLLLAITGVLLFSYFQIDIASSVVRLDCTKTILLLIGVVGLLNWVVIAFFVFANRNQIDRNMAHATIGRLVYILLLVVSIPCVIYFLIYFFDCQLPTSEILDEFNENIIDPFLNHEDFSFSQSLISLLGTFLLSGVLVSMLVSFINQRAERWEKGELYYNFQISNYRIVVGGHSAVPSLARKLVEKYKSDKLVIFTSRDILSFRREVESCLEESQKERVIFYHGYRNSEEDLKHLHVTRDNLKAIYILGESRVHGEEETSHDTLNMTCLDIMNKIRGDEKERIDCYVFFEHQTTSVIFQKFANNEKYHSLNFIPYNFYELQAQKAIGWSVFLKKEKKQEKPLRLDRFGADVVNADKHVHMVIIGMSKMGQALGLEAIRVCHYPNFAQAQMQYEYANEKGKAHNAKKLMERRRTKITFIDCNMKEILNSFKCRYGRLLDEVQWSYVDYDYPLKSQSHPLRDNNQKIVPDIELEFVNGRIQAEKVIEHLKTISSDRSSVLTIASCLSKSNLSIASILCLPKDVLEKAEIMIYQPDSTKLVESISINEDADNVKAFGEISQAVDLEHIDTLETMAKRVNNVYVKKQVLDNISLSDFSEKEMIRFEKENGNLCEKAWIVKEKCVVCNYKLKVMTESRRWANRYHASAIWQKVHYVDNNMDIEKIVTKGITENDGCPQEDFEGLMARTEHNRYCIEQWLLDRIKLDDEAFKSYKCLKEEKSKYAEFPTNDQIMTMAIPYIIHDVIDCETLNVS